MFEKDYILRLINEIIRTVIMLVFHKDIRQEEELFLQDREAAARLETLKEMVDRGDINGAENILYEEISKEDVQGLELALAFYDYVNGKTDEYLECCGFTRKEVIEGIVTVTEMYGFGGIAEALLKEDGED